MRVRIHFHSYYKDLTGCAQIEEDVSPGTTVGEMLPRLYSRFPKLEPMAKSTLLAVGVEYQGRSYRLKDGDELSLFPPVQGG
jgi:molybdopterin converting factor small subunit